MTYDLRIGQTVKVQGSTYQVTGIRSLRHLGSKYFNKYRFELEAADGTRWVAAGRTVTYNSRLAPVE